MTPTATRRPATYNQDASMAQFSTARYDRMVETGILDDTDQVELLEGYVVLKMPQNPRHVTTVGRVQAVLSRALPPGWLVRTQAPLALPDSRPEPDLAVARGDLADYENRHPAPPEVGLLVEVSDTSLKRDTQDKTRIYARAEIVAYWVLDVSNREVLVYTQPSGPTADPAYAACDRFRPGDAVPFVLDGTTHAAIAVSDLLG